MTTVVDFVSKSKNQPITKALSNKEKKTELQTKASFDSIMNKNKETQERLRQERLLANKTVLKNYKIK